MLTENNCFRWRLASEGRTVTLRSLRLWDDKPALACAAYHRNSVGLNEEAKRRNRRLRVVGDTWTDFVDTSAPDEDVESFWRTVAECNNVDWILPVTNPALICYRLPEDWRDGYPNVSLGAYVSERKDALHAIAALRSIPVRRRFLWIEAMLEDFGKIQLAEMDWVVLDRYSPGVVDPEANWRARFVEQADQQGVRILINETPTYA